MRTNLGAWARRIGLGLVAVLWLLGAHPQAQTAPVISWTHSGTNVTHFQIVIGTAETWVVDAGLPTPSGTTYEYALPALPAGQWPVKVRACYGADCQDSAALSIVKMVPAGATALNYYWVDDDGAVTTWANCKSDTPLSGAAACNLDTANVNIAAGQTVFLRGGTYTLSGLNAKDMGVAPSASGTLESGVCTAPITYRGHPNETPVIQGYTTSGSYYGIYLMARSCIRALGLTFSEIKTYGNISSAHYNEIAYNTFTATTTSGEVGSGLMIKSDCPEAYDCWNTHNWIHHNLIEKKRNGVACGEATDLIRIGTDDSVYGGADMTAANNYNTVSDNEIRYASHTPLDSYGNYGVIARNYIHNEPWWTGDDATCNYPNDTFDNVAFRGKYGHRAMQLSDGYDRDSMYTLVEGNRTGFGSTNAMNNGADSMDIAGPRNIVRHNDIFGAMNSCLMFKYGWGLTGGNGGTYNKAYNNTLHHCGYGNGAFYELDQAACVAAGGLNCSTQPQALEAVDWYVTQTVGNVLKNNLMSDSRRYVLSGWDIGYGAGTPGNPDGTVLANNWGGADGAPLFVDTTVTPASRTQPNLALQAASGAIDISTDLGRLTQANGASDGDETPSVTLIVDDNDAWYFQDGTWGSNLTRTAGVMFPDWIAVGTVDNVAQISSINYATHTITLASPLTWADNASVWLYKKSDGVVVLVGSAPDYGAHEYGVGTAVAPTGVVVR